MAGVPSDRRPLARHRARAQRQPAPARRVGAPRRAAALRHRPDVAVGLRAARARAGVHLRRHHGRHHVAHRLRAVRQGTACRLAGRRLHGQQRRAPARSGISTADIPISAGRWRMQWRHALCSTTHHAEARRRRPAMRALIERCSSTDAARPPGDIGLAAMDDGAALRLGDGGWSSPPTRTSSIPSSSRRRHRPARGLGHGQRPGDDGRHRGARPDLRGDHRGGFRRADLERIQRSMRETCARPARRSSPATPR